MWSKYVNDPTSLDDFSEKTFGIANNISPTIRPIAELTDCLYVCFGTHIEPCMRALIFFRYGQTQAWLNTRNINGWHGWKALV